MWEKDDAKKEWPEQKFGLGLNMKIFDVEMWNISEAFEVAERKTWQIWQLQIINIICKSQTIINHLKSCDSDIGQVIKMQIYQNAGKPVQQKHSVFIRQILAHNRVEKNKRANKAAKKAAMKEKV